jgi:hypothetical protein
MRSPRTPTASTAVLRDGDGRHHAAVQSARGGRTPEQIAAELVNQTFPDTKTAYEIPNAMVGYSRGTAW